MNGGAQAGSGLTARSPEVLGVLREVFGLQDYRGFQEQAIDGVLAGRDGLLTLPTGGGKSLVYQLPALVLPGLTLVVSPLIALMQDQVQALRAKGCARRF
ncbi:MAG: DEAD/DEAH box helicase [Planctomycetota bacterium]